MKFGQAISHLLAGYGVDTIFGIPGVHTIELYRDLDQAGIRAVVPRHEQGAGFMADAYARTTGRPGVCYLVSGPGLLNAMTPIAQAWHDSVPVLVVSSTVATTELGRHRGALHDIPDQGTLLAPFTSISEVVTDPFRFAELVADAFAGWATSRPRPVHLSVPVDVLGHEVDVIARVELPARYVPPLDPQALEAAVRQITASTSPVIIAGGGATTAAAQVRELAELVGCPVVTTGNAKGLLPADHPLAVGTGLPFPATQAMIADADVVIAIGTEFSETDVIYTGSPLRITGELIRLDIDPHQSHPDLHLSLNAPIALTSSAADGCRALLRALGAISEPAPGASARTAAARDGVAAAAVASGHLDWIDALARALSDDAVVTLDSTQLAYTTHHFLPWSTPRTWLAPFGLGTLGPALPMAVGAAVACPDRPVVAIAGDGGVLFTLSELATAMDLQRQLTLVIWDNAGYGEIRDSFDRAGIRRVGTDVTAQDLVMIAQGFGAVAVHVDTPEQLETMVTASLSRTSPTVIVVTAP